jgi:amino acid adenylation domain-containing protein
MLIDSLLEEAARIGPDRVAIVTPERSFRYAEIDARANAAARALMDLGVSRGDRVAICLDNGAETVIAIFAALKAGAVFVPLHPAIKAPRLRLVLRDAGACALVVGTRTLSSATAALADLPDLRVIVCVGEPPVRPGHPALVTFEDMAPTNAPASEPPPKRAIDLDLAALPYTSGSSGEPKGVMLSHRNVRSATASIVRYLRLRTDDVLFDVLPLSFGYGLTQLFSAFAVGATLVLENGFVFPHTALARMAEVRATGFAMVPTIAAAMVQRDLASYDLTRLRYVTNAGAALPVECARKLRAALPSVELFCMYGQTECLRIAYLPSHEVDARPDSVGRAIPNTEAWVADDRGERLPPGHTGELVVRGSHVMMGYWRRDEDTAARLRWLPRYSERVLFTGDLFTEDADGYLRFVARTDEIFKCRGEKVSPREVEEVILRMPGVAEVAVVGVPDAAQGLAVKAVVVPAPGAVVDSRAVRGHCAAYLEDFMIPGIVEISSSLPRTANGKVSKKELVP